MSWSVEDPLVLGTHKAPPPPPPSRSNFFISTQFSANILPNNRLGNLLLGLATLPPPHLVPVKILSFPYSFRQIYMYCQFFKIFMEFSVNILPNNRLGHLPLGLAPPPSENLGSATDSSRFLSCDSRLHIQNRHLNVLFGWPFVTSRF